MSPAADNDNTQQENDHESSTLSSATAEHLSERKRLDHKAAYSRFMVYAREKREEYMKDGKGPNSFLKLPEDLETCNHNVSLRLTAKKGKKKMICPSCTR